jgi:signal transduction histidine kinase
VAQNGTHLLSLINSILDLSKIEAGKMDLEVSEVDLGTLIMNVLELFEAQAQQKGIALHSGLPERMAPIRADEIKMKQILFNLVGNALKFTEKGSVTVKVASVDQSGAPLRVDIIDTGIGIPKDSIDTIFLAFQQADAGIHRRFGGTGLGLTITKAMLKLMGMGLEVRSEIGRGSTFTILLA